MFDLRHAITVAIRLKNKTDIRVTQRSCRSVNLCFERGRAMFSEQIAAGARIAELVVLMIAESSDPKNKICIGSAVCFITIAGKASCESAITSAGYRCLIQRLINKGRIAMVRYSTAAMWQDLTAVLAELEDIERWKTSCDGSDPSPRTLQAAM